MKTNIARKFKSLSLVPAVSMMLASIPANAGPFDWSGWNSILAQRVKAVSIDGISLNGFDYQGLSKSRAPFDKLVSSLQDFDPSGLDSRAEKLAFWINAYNLGAVKMVLDHPGITTLNEVGPKKGAVWKMDVLIIGKKQYSLDVIEHKILRKMGEPRIHFAVVCASLSCPDIRSEAYFPAKLEKQLEDQTRIFLANPSKGMRFDLTGKKIVLTKLFEWFGEDFGGKDGIIKFVAAYLPRSQKPPVGWKEFGITYFDYNWKLNGL
jgi:hypothetical protein